jgi:hypothetical protein
MVESPQNPRSAYAEGMKWVLALSIAAVAGAFLHLSDLSKLPVWLKLTAAGDTAAFLVGAFLGVQYLIRVFTDDVRRKQLSDTEGNASATEADKDRAEDLRLDLSKSDTSRPKLYRWHAISTCIAAVLTLVFLPAAILTFKDDAKKLECPCGCTTVCQGTNQISIAPDRFAIVYSAAHPGRGGQVQHTFLLDQQTGNLWQMVCRKNGTVAFEETPRQKAP